GRQAVPIQIPMGVERGFKGVIDLISLKGFLYGDDESGKFQTLDATSPLPPETQAARDRLMEAVAEVDDALMEEFFSEGSVSQEDLVGGRTRGIRARRISPVLCTAGAHNTAMPPLLDALVSYIPTPGERGPFAGENPKDPAPAERKGTADEA